MERHREKYGDWVVTITKNDRVFSVNSYYVFDLGKFRPVEKPGWSGTLIRKFRANGTLSRVIRLNPEGFKVGAYGVKGGNEQAGELRAAARRGRVRALIAKPAMG